MSGKVTLVKILLTVLENLNQSDKKTVDQSMSGMEKMLGDDWTLLPVNSLTLLALTIVLNKVLTPRGITPRRIVLATLDVAEKAGFDKAANEIFQKTHEWGKITSEKLEGLYQTIRNNSATSYLVQGTATKAKKVFSALKKPFQRTKADDEGTPPE